MLQLYLHVGRMSYVVTALHSVWAFNFIMYIDSIRKSCLFLNFINVYVYSIFAFNAVSFSLSIYATHAGSHQGPHEKRLLNTLLGNYNTLERPVSNESDALTVRFGLTLQQIIDVVRAFFRTHLLDYCMLLLFFFM